jgi:hypothetical protein
MRVLAVLMLLAAVPAAAGEHGGKPVATVEHYIVALGNTRNIGHDRLKNGKVELVDRGPFGMEPWTKSGANAWVFKVHGDDGKTMAVRTFMRPDDSRARRFSAMQTFLAKRKTLRMVPFDYREEGVMVQHEHGQEWEPALFLDWAHGARLDHHVDKLVAAGDKKALGKLAQSWRSLMARLRAAKVAHGDLQHGNVLVEGNAFTLLDPDAMYVPGLEPGAVIELGHRNFQHPDVIQGRVRGYDERMDHFAGLVVYLSLRALEADPTLWSERVTDEGLLLSERDYHDPAGSAMVARLRQSASDEVRMLTEALVTGLGNDAAAMPHLEELLPAVAKKTRAKKPAVPPPVSSSAPSASANVFADFAGR